MSVGQFHLRPAKRSEAKPLIGIYSESGCGKTLSALFLARGFVGPTGKIGMIETEAGRGEAYADTLPGSYGVISIRDDFSPRNYGEAITVAERSNLDALIIDSASHEWESTGGVLSMAAKNQEDGKKGQLVWQIPKMDHQRHFMLRLLATPIPLVIVCMRAKYPMQEVKVIKDGKEKKEWVRSETLDPKQSDDILFEMFVHGWIDRQHNFHGTKYTLDELRTVIQDGKPISIETGANLAEWARGGAVAMPSKPVDAKPATKAEVSPEDRSKWLVEAFTAKLPPKYKPEADQLLVEFVRTLGYVSVATMAKISDDKFREAAKQALNHALTIGALAL